MIFKKVLFHTHFREMALNSLKTMMELKKAGLETIILTHIIPRDEVSFVPYGGYMKETELQMKAEARMRFEDWQEILSQNGLASRIRIEVGAPNAEILSIAEESGTPMPSFFGYILKYSLIFLVPTFVIVSLIFF